jgi:hypothetical protein
MTTRDASSGTGGHLTFVELVIAPAGVYAQQLFLLLPLLMLAQWHR